MFCFSAGQYVLVHLRINGAAITRAYSVSSPPTRRLDLQITVKRTQGGLTSNWIHDHLTPGSEIEMKGRSVRSIWINCRRRNLFSFRAGAA
ncbi:hypothetical protein X765_01050 [Mesorhizobium sp. LSHC440B00]|nr:hypothetical protein X765_01050 [Mesorhizobium sp. LSHC440B00]ESX33822.1 hypothetical protein X764_29250 [Mesorhizobium sp. LSHC440A00]ESX40121.1 hypothetical protein X763_07360 [Mesorhizobium sp. LSHC432A00]ESZ37805.1 hypothetical protein X731_29375 [Mesorhizobium sp. L2C054A000]